MNKPENKSGLEYKGTSKYCIKAVILEDGTKLDLEKITHLLIIKERNINDIGGEFCITQKINSIDDCQTMSNQAFMCSTAFKNMKKYGMSFEDGIKAHIKFINERLKNG